MEVVSKLFPDNQVCPSCSNCTFCKDCPECYGRTLQFDHTFYSLEYDLEIIPLLPRLSPLLTIPSNINIPSIVTLPAVSSVPLVRDPHYYMLKQLGLKIPAHQLKSIQKQLMDTVPKKSTFPTPMHGLEQLYTSLERVLSNLRNYTEHSLPFLKPVQRKEAPNYYDVILNPMDLQTMSKKLRMYVYHTKAEFESDLELIWSNCLIYNTVEGSHYRAKAMAMRKRGNELLRRVLEVKESEDEESEEEMIVEEVIIPIVKEESVAVTVEDSEEVVREVTFDADPALRDYKEVTWRPRAVNLIRYLEERNLPFGDQSAILERSLSTTNFFPELYTMSAPGSSTSVHCIYRNDKPRIPFAPPPSLSEFSQIRPAESVLNHTLLSNVNELRRIKGTSTNPYQKTYQDHNLPHFNLTTETSHSILERIITTLLLHAGFDSSSQTSLAYLTCVCTTMLTTVASTYKKFEENGKLTYLETILNSLEDIGINHPSELNDYIEHSVVRYGSRLVALRKKMDIAVEDDDIDLSSGRMLDMDVDVDWFGLKEIGVETQVPRSVWEGKNHILKAKKKEIKEDIAEKEAWSVNREEWKAVDSSVIGLLKGLYTNGAGDEEWDKPLSKEAKVVMKIAAAGGRKVVLLVKKQAKVEVKEKRPKKEKRKKN